jgi:hypothetical protein
MFRFRQCNVAGGAGFAGIQTCEQMRGEVCPNQRESNAAVSILPRICDVTPEQTLKHTS